MENKGVLTKVLAISGTVLIWLPILIPILLSAIYFIQEKTFLFDYLMPAELFFLTLIGGGLLLWAGIRLRAHWKMIAWGLGIAVVMLVGGQALAVVTGLADGSTSFGGWQTALVLGSLAVYSMAIIAAGIGGVLLIRDLFKQRRSTPLTN